MKVLDNLSQQPVTLFANLGQASQILYYTKHNVVATPYHRHEQGLIALYKLMEQPYNEATAKEILKTTKTDYVIIDLALIYKNPKYFKSFAGMIANKSYPPWTDSALIPTEFDNNIVLKINRDML